MGHAEFTLSRDAIEGMDDMAALSATIRQATGYRAAQRAYDDRTDDRGDRDAQREARAAIARAQAQAEAEQAMAEALFGVVPVAAMRSNEGRHSPATLVSTLLGADDPAVNDLMLQALRLACVPCAPQLAGERAEQAAEKLRAVAGLLCQRFGAEHGAAYLGGAL